MALYNINRGGGGGVRDWPGCPLSIVPGPQPQTGCALEPTYGDADTFSHVFSPTPPARSSPEFHETGSSFTEKRQLYFEPGCIQGPYFNVSSRLPFSFVGVRSRRSSALPVPHYCTATQGRMGRRTGVRRTAQLKSKVDTHAPERRVPQSGASAGRSAHRRESRARGALRRGQNDRFSLSVLKVF